MLHCSFAPRLLLTALVLLLPAYSACGDVAPGPGDAGSDADVGVDSSAGADAGADAGPGPDLAEPLFAAKSIPRFDITLSEDAIRVLNNRPEIYVKADLQIELDGQSFALADVGVRLKGRYGSYRDLSGKSAFLLDFNRFVPGQRVLGLEKLALNNMVQDPSMIHERIGYTLFRSLGVPAPRSAYATVHVNGELYGLYATVEASDNDNFLETWFGDDGGNLYEGQYGSDLEVYLASTFDLDNGVELGFEDIFAFAHALDGMTNPETFMTDVAKVLDIESYVRFAATEIFLGHWDGYAWTRNNYFMYRRSSDDRWAFIPWGLDQTFYEYLDPFGGGGRLQMMCDASIPCRQALARAYEQLLANVESLNLAGQAAALQTLIWGAMVADPRKEVAPETVSASIAAAIAFLGDRSRDVQQRLGCANPGSTDADGDGSPGCGIDCNDLDPDIHPGAPELCNQIDDNCDGTPDNAPECPHCQTQSRPGGGALALCYVPATWQVAEADCAAQGGHLASIHDQSAQDAVASAAFAISAGDWWIGLSDQAIEGDFRWADGTPFDFAAWNDGEPNNSGGNENCVHLSYGAGSLWNDLPCDIPLNYVCALPSR